MGQHHPGTADTGRALTTWPSRQLCGSAPSAPQSPWRPRGHSAKDEFHSSMARLCPLHVPIPTASPSPLCSPRPHPHHVPLPTVFPSCPSPPHPPPHSVPVPTTSPSPPCPPPLHVPLPSTPPSPPCPPPHCVPLVPSPPHPHPHSVPLPSTSPALWPYVGAECQQAVGVLRVVGDLCQRVEGQLGLHKVLGKVRRAEDAAAAAATGDITCQDDLGMGHSTGLSTETSLSARGLG